MDELEISGRRHISAVRAAKEYKYHSDYIGQLVRGGKVVGQKVGRAWYVEVDSLADYLGEQISAPEPVAVEVMAKPVVEFLTEETAAPVIEAHIEKPSERSEQKDFLLPLRKSGRQHVIAAIDVDVQETKQEVKQEIKKEKKQEETQKEKVEPEFTPKPEEVAAEEEVTFIPLKITKQVSEPEDSFYKVSPRSLQYVARSGAAPVAVLHHPAARVQNNRSFGAQAAKAVGVLVVAGTLSLGVAVIASYYLYSMTTIGPAGQTSSIVLSQ